MIYHCITGCWIIYFSIQYNSLCHFQISRLVDINMADSICIAKSTCFYNHYGLFHENQKECKRQICWKIIVDSILITSVTKNRNFGGILNLRDQFVAASWDHQINNVIQLPPLTINHFNWSILFKYLFVPTELKYISYLSWCFYRTEVYYHQFIT